MPKTDRPILPNFLIAGAAKCGTTSLYHYLKKHPDVFLSETKEPNFLYQGLGESRPMGAWGQGEKLSASSYDEYCRHFENGAGCKAVGEASTTTVFYYDRAIPAIRRYLGDPRIIIILRDPVERAYSNYNYLHREMRETLPFEEALRAEDARTRQGYGLMWRYKAVGLYTAQVRAYQKNFSRVQVLLYDDLKRNSVLLVKQIYRFLEVDPGFIPDVSQRHNASTVPINSAFNSLFVKPLRLQKMVRKIGAGFLGNKRWVQLRERIRMLNMKRPEPMPVDTERKLRHYFKEDVLRLQDCIRRDLSAWLKDETVEEARGYGVSAKRREKPLVFVSGVASNFQNEKFAGKT